MGEQPGLLQRAALKPGAGGIMGVGGKTPYCVVNKGGNFVMTDVTRKENSVGEQHEALRSMDPKSGNRFQHLRGHNKHSLRTPSLKPLSFLTTVTFF